jgi:hypothetical protein
MMLENGLLFSCSYDRTVKVWQYKRNEFFADFTKADDLRCMDYLPDEGTLLIGTNSGAILSHRIEEYLRIDERFDLGMITMGDMEDEFQDNDDALDGMSVDEYSDKILREQLAITSGKATFKK